MAHAAWRIDDLAQRSGLTVDTIRYYQREGLLPEGQRAGRAKLYGPEHLERLTQIRDLQAKRFSLAAIRALLEAERPGIVDVFAEDATALDRHELLDRAGIDAAVVEQVEAVGLLRDPADFGRDGYDGVDVDLLRTVGELVELGLPPKLVADLAAIYVEGVEAMQGRVLQLFARGEGQDWSEDELREFQSFAAASAGRLLPLVSRIVEYVHQRTLQRLTLRAIEAASPAGRTGDDSLP